MMFEKISHYRILHRLGAGGMGEVYLAEDTLLNRKVAIKLLPADTVADEQAEKRLIKEAQAAAALDHPNICAIHEVGRHGGYSFIVMQYVEGETLAGRMKKSPLEFHEALDIAVQVADGFAEAHSRGIIHRDIKPQNIMITGRGQAKLMDFGLAKAVRQKPLAESEAETESLFTEPGMVVGTVPYMSPEQVRGEALDARSDIFSFGAVLYEMMSGRQPFTAESPAAIFSAILTREPPPLARYSSEVPVELQRILNKVLNKEREERYQTAKDLLVDLKILKQGLEIEAKLERPTHPALDGEAAVKASSPPPVDTAKQATLTGQALAARTTSSAEYLISGIKQHKRAAVLVVLLLLIVSAGLGYLRFVRSSSKAIDSIAVLPFANASNDPSTEYLSD